MAWLVRSLPPISEFGFSEIALDREVETPLFRFVSRLLLEGRFAIVTNVRRDAVDADGAQTNAPIRGRRSRVVPTPRCWCQVLKKLTLLRDDGGKKARFTRESAKISR